MKYLLSLLIVLSCCSGCAVYRVAPPGAPVAEVASPKKTYWRVGWRFTSPDIRMDSAFNCHGNGVAEVTYVNNYFYSLISVLTFNFVSPVQITWKCSGTVPVYTH